MGLDPCFGFHKSNVSAGCLAASISAACSVQKCHNGYIEPSECGNEAPLTKCRRGTFRSQVPDVVFTVAAALLGEYFPESKWTGGVTDAPGGPGMTWNSARV